MTASSAGTPLFPLPDVVFFPKTLLPLQARLGERLLRLAGSVPCRVRRENLRYHAVLQILRNATKTQERIERVRHLYPRDKRNN